tara:strand:- start:1295 stop:1903 length:609 start_codon:yes stop_codon:yes gene_type:complete
MLKHYYINLNNRKDRKNHVIKELSKIGIQNPNRFDAIKHTKGYIGCSISHLNIIKLAKKNNWDYVCVFEDDIIFLNPTETMDKLKKILYSNLKWDVLLLGGNNWPPYQRINEDCIQVSNCTMTHAYIVKKNYYDNLINTWEEGLDKLIKTDNKLYSCDMVWKKLQKKDTFLLITPVKVAQIEGYSDILKKNVNNIQKITDLK